MADRKLGTARETAVAKLYQPTPADAQALEAFVAARKRAAPRLKVAPNTQGAEHVTIDHPDKAFALAAPKRGAARLSGRRIRTAT